MYKYTSVPTGNLDQRWDHGIWVSKAPMTDEHIILTEMGSRKRDRCTACHLKKDS